MADLTKLPPVPAGCLPTGVTDQHGKDAFEVRFGTATAEATKTGTVPHTTNGDETLADHSATYTKCLMQTGFGIVNPAAFALFKAALSSGVPTDFEKPGLLGGTRKLNGPLGAFARNAVPVLSGWLLKRISIKSDLTDGSAIAI